MGLLLPARRLLGERKVVTLSVIIVSYNTAALLRACLRSVEAALAEETSLEGEVWVVDNASADGSVQMVRREFPRVRLIANEQNRGFAAANNQALAQCQDEYLLLLNPDTELWPRALPLLIGFLESHPRAGLVGPQLLYPDGSFQHAAYRFPTLAMSFLDLFPLHHRLLDSRLNGRYPRAAYDGPPFEIDHPLGACLALPRQAVDQVGLLDEDLFFYCEEIDWALRLRQAGWRAYCVPQAQVVHHGAQSTSQVWGPAFVQLQRSRLLLFQKHYSPGFLRAHRLILRAGMGWARLRTAWAYRRGRLSPQQYQERRDTFAQVLRLLG